MNTGQAHIDAYVALLLSNRRFLNAEYRKFVDNCYILENIDGDIDPDILNKVIRKAKWNPKLRSMLTGILWYVDGNSITNENFRLLLQFPRRKRNTYLGAISHANLAFYQMLTINKVSSPFEAFAWLFDRICENRFFSEADMLQILNDASDITVYGIQNCIDIMRKKYGDSPKLEIAEKWIERMAANRK